MAEAAVARIGDLGGAGGAERGVRGDRQARRRAIRGGDDGEAIVGLLGDLALRDHAKARQWRSLDGQAAAELVEPLRHALHFDERPVPIVADQAGQPQLAGETGDEGPETDPLHPTAHRDTPTHGRTVGGDDALQPLGPTACGSGRAGSPARPMPNRWTICLLGMALQVCLGTAYAWSYFQKPLSDAFGWSNSVTAWAFCLAICFLGLSAAWGGMQLARFGPRRLAMAGGALFGLGWLLGALALSLGSPTLLFLGYGVVGGCGLGLAYVTPVATVAKWFPDRKGLATGLVIMGFGLGALAMSKLFAPLLVEFFRAGAGSDGQAMRTVLAQVFASLGVIFLVLTVPLGWFMRDPPPSHAPAGSPPPDSGRLTARECILSRRFAVMWLVFFCNITAGIAIIGFQSPLFQDLWRARDSSLDVATLATYGATLIAATSLFNGFGRFAWGGLSDRIGRQLAFSLMLGSQILVFLALAKAADPWLFAVLCCWVLLCYGGGFGAMPSFILDVFGARLMPVVYGCILTAWSAAGIVGPQLVAVIRDTWPQQAGRYAFFAGAGFVTLGFLATFLLSNRPFARRT